MTHEQIEKLKSGHEMDTLIAALMEPQPEPVSARELRTSEPGKGWDSYSDQWAYSPGGWWKAQIGTAHSYNPDGSFWIERDEAPVVWNPAKEPSNDITAAWEVFIAGLIAHGTADINADMENYGRGLILGDGPEEVMHVSIGDWTVVDKAEVAICRAFLHAHLGEPE